MKVFIVDDDAAARLTARAALDEIDVPEDAIREFADGSTLLEALATETTDLILLDIEMPGMDGIAACRGLRADGHDTTQVMFVSAHNDLETRLAAYDAGGNDFIVKPYELQELARKVDVALQYTSRRHDLAEQARYAQRTAFSAMSSLGEMGVLIEFLRASFACDTAAALAGKLLDALRQFDLDGLVELRPAAGRQCHSSRGVCSPLECSILEHASGMERIFQFRDRLAINYPGITLLAFKLPLDDPERIGRLRDHLAILAEGADARLQAMEIARRQLQQTMGIGEAVSDLTKTLAEIDKIQAAHRLRATEIDETYHEDLVKAFVHLGLSEDQESTLTDLAQRAHRQTASLRDEDRSVGDHLREVTRKLEKLTQV